jgi:hypothetical protein
MIDALGELPSRCVLRTMAKKVRGSHRSDLTTVRNCAIVRSVAIALRTRSVQVTVQVPYKFVNSRITDKRWLFGMQVSNI